MAENKYISKVAISDDNGQSIYEIKDSEARNAIDNLFIEEIILNCGKAPIEE